MIHIWSKKGEQGRLVHPSTGVKKDGFDILDDVVVKTFHHFLSKTVCEIDLHSSLASCFIEVCRRQTKWMIECCLDSDTRGSVMIISK